ncbi:hypothetical protein [Dysosmobacter sp.]|uniref:hypothetical protein n=1 Tax=Dysosmobacter sp. TaxID=2591382 RepID=UPI003AB2B9EF
MPSFLNQNSPRPTVTLLIPFPRKAASIASLTTLSPCRFLPLTVNSVIPREQQPFPDIRIPHVQYAAGADLNGSGQRTRYAPER